MKIHASFRIIILCTQLSVILLEAQGRRESTSDLQEYAKHHTDHEPNIRLDDHFWIYTKKPKDTKHHVQELDDHFWIYTKKPKDTKHPVQELDDHFWIYTKKPKDTKHPVQESDDHSWWIYAANNQAKYHHEHETSPHHQELDPKLRIFFTPRDLEPGKVMSLYFPRKKAETNSKLHLTREEADSFPFSSSYLPSLLELFSINVDSAQGRSMKDTLEQCELEPVDGELKFCATSTESMVESVNQILISSGMESLELATTYHSITMISSTHNFTIMDTPKQVDASKMIGCHPMQYPYDVFYCHSQLESGQSKLYHVSLAGDNGDMVDALAVCHMDTSLWDPDHVAFRVLSVRPGSDSPVCHFFPEDSLVWIPVPSSNRA